jgi:predicted MFS family arabinose efflux permease
VPASTATEAFTWNFAVITVGMAGGNALGGVVSEVLGPGPSFLVAGATGLAGALAGVLGLAGRPACRGSPPESPGLTPGA